MRIAIVIEHFDASRGGAERLAGWVAREMARRGHEVHVICHDMAARVSRYRQATLRASFDAHRSRRALGTAYGVQLSDAPAEPAPPHGLAGGAVESGKMASPRPAAPWKVHVHKLQGMRLHTALGFRLFGRRARALCRRGGGAGGKAFDVVHSFTVACPGDLYHAQAGVYAAMQAQAEAMREEGADRTWKRILQRLPGKRRTLLTLERRAVARSGMTISSCAMMTEQFAAYYPHVARQVVTLRTPRIDEEKDTRANEDPTLKAARDAEDRAWFRGHYGIVRDDRVALFVGHDFRRKGLRQAIEAVAQTTEWKLVVVGLGKVRAYVELAQALGLMPEESPDGPATGQGDREMAVPRRDIDARRAARVMFVGPTREVGAVYAAADALLLPAFYEPSSMVALEALAHGLPVICSAFVGAADLVAEYQAGLVIADPQDVASLAGALEQLPATGSAEAQALAQRATHAAASVTAAGFADRLEGLYRAVGK